MGQSATLKRSPHGIEPFWEKPSADPPLKWEKWQMQAKLALLAKESLALDILLETKPEAVQLPVEPIYENTITGSSAQSERERLARNAQLKMNRENRCQKQIELVIMRGDKPWAQADPKNSINAISQFGHRGKADYLQREPASQNGHIDNSRALEYHGTYIHPSAKHYL